MINDWIIVYGISVAHSLKPEHLQKRCPRISPDLRRFPPERNCTAHDLQSKKLSRLEILSDHQVIPVNRYGLRYLILLHMGLYNSIINRLVRHLYVYIGMERMQARLALTPVRNQGLLWRYTRQTV